MVVDTTIYKTLDSKLTYNIPSFDGSVLTTIKNLKVINYDLGGGKMLVSIPVGRTDLIPSNYTVEDKRFCQRIDFPEFLFPLREGSQQEIYDSVEDNCIINAKVGFGKTFLGLAIASKLMVKTLVVTHTVALREQWEQEIEKTLGIKPGIIGSGRFNINSPIVVANVQSLVKNIPTINREFGLVILDEMHHVSAPTFSKVIDSMFARYKIGLSGTIERKDQKHVVFKDYFGSKLYQPDRENTIEPSVDIIHSYLEFPSATSLSWAEKVNTLLGSYVYRDLVVKLTDKYTREGHKVLVVADRVEFLEYINNKCQANSEILVGSTKDRQGVINNILDGQSSVLCGTQSMVSEGLSINPLSCLILATPLNNIPLLEQLIGRIVRESPGKKSPVIVDIKLLGSSVGRQFNNRLGHYMKSDYIIRNVK